ncbi:MAG: hypothetical protein U5L96_21440 [Owenweeksia sp.]|nr:hypothetical protein [Owenweeksia sp.]
MDGTFNLQTPIGLSWSPSSNAVVYDIYVWEKGTGRPSFPQVSNISAISTSYSNLTSGKNYYWQVVAENSCFQVFSDTNEFNVIGIPDLTRRYF